MCPATSVRMPVLVRRGATCACGVLSYLCDSSFDKKSRLSCAILLLIYFEVESDRKFLPFREVFRPVTDGRRCRSLCSRDGGQKGISYVPVKTRVIVYSIGVGWQRR